KAEIQEAVARLADTGVSVVFISSELDEVVRLSDRIVVLRDQQKIGEITNGPAVTVQDVVDLIAAESDEEGEEKVDAMEEKASASLKSDSPPNEYSVSSYIANTSGRFWLSSR